MYKNSVQIIVTKCHEMDRKLCMYSTHAQAIEMTGIQHSKNAVQKCCTNHRNQVSWNGPQTLHVVRTHAQAVEMTARDSAQYKCCPQGCTQTWLYELLGNKG